MGEEEIGQLRLIGAAAALGDHRGHGLKAMGLVQRDRVLRQRHQPDRKLDRVALKAPRQPVSVPALVELAEVFADLFGQADPLRDPLGHLAVAGENRNADLLAFGKALLDRLGQFVGRHVGEKSREGADEGLRRFPSGCPCR